jgi:hypothetical protein
MVPYTWSGSSSFESPSPTFSGHTTQTKQRVEVCLENGLILHAHLCLQSCLPLLPFVPSDMPTSFWYDAFAYSATNVA